MPVRVLAELIRRAPASGVVSIRQEEIAAVLGGVATKTVYRALKVLLATDCVVVDRVANQPNEYKIQRDLASGRIAIVRYLAHVRDVSEPSDEMSGPNAVELEETASRLGDPPMSDAPAHILDIRARDSVSSSSSSSGQDTPDTSATMLEDLPRAESDRILSDVRRLQPAGLLRSARIEPTSEACAALALLDFDGQLEAIRRCLNGADRPNPAYLVKCVNSILLERADSSLPKLFDALYPPLRLQADPAPVAVRQAPQEAAQPVEDVTADTFAVVVAERLRLAMGDRTLRGVAKAAGISAGALSDYLAAKRAPASWPLRSLARELEVSVDWLIGGGS